MRDRRQKAEVPARWPCLRMSPMCCSSRLARGFLKAEMAAQAGRRPLPILDRKAAFRSSGSIIVPATLLTFGMGIRSSFGQDARLRRTRHRMHVAAPPAVHGPTRRRGGIGTLATSCSTLALRTMPARHSFPTMEVSISTSGPAIIVMIRVGSSRPPLSLRSGFGIWTAAAESRQVTKASIWVNKTPGASGRKRRAVTTRTGTARAVVTFSMWKQRVHASSIPCVASAAAAQPRCSSTTPPWTAGNRFRTIQQAI